MRKIAYLTILILFAFTACGSDDDNSLLRRTYIDISDFKMYRGTSQGAVEVQFNNLKKKELVSKYLGKVYSPTEYSSYTMQFNGSKLNFTIGSENRGGRQIISDYKYSNDTLYILNADTLLFVSLVDNNNNLYRMKGLIGYPNPDYTPTPEPEPGEEEEETVNTEKNLYKSLDETLSLSRVLEIAGYSNLQDITNPEDTIVWCNVKYLFY